MDREKLVEAVRKALEPGDDVLAVYLYGSMAEGTYHSESDIDLAVLFESSPEDLPELDLASKISTSLDAGRKIDVRVLNDSGLRFTHQVLKNGERIVTKDEKRAADFEESFYRKYLDMKPLIQEHDRLRMERLSS